MRIALRRRAHLALVLTFALHAPARADEAKRPIDVSVRNGRIDARLVDAPVRGVVDDIARQTHADVRGQLPLDRRVSVQFADLPLEEGLRRILGDLSFALLYDDAGHLRTIDLRGGPQAARPRGPEEPAGSPPGGSNQDAIREASERLRTFALQDRRIPVHGRLARALGGETATFQTITEAAFNNDDATVRADARRVALRTLESDRDAREALVTIVTSLPEAELTNVVRSMAREHAAELAEAVARDAHTDALRASALTVARRIQDDAAAR